MTGIERLREFVAGITPITVVCGVTKMEYDRGHREEARACLRDFLAEIADQIARDHAEDCHRMGLEHGAVSRVITDMERHVSGVEGMDDSPVARWARELREALGRQCRDGESDSVADSPYDAIRPEDREAISWVRRQGGLEMVRRMFRDADNRRVELCGALGIDLDKGWSEAMAAMRLRLMPEGMEWPRYEGGELVRIGDEFMGKDGKTYTVKQIKLIGKFYALYDFCDAKPQFVASYGERVKRPAPKDSWERLEEDVANASCPDVYCANHRIDASDTSYEWAMARDIVRRAKALAGDA